MSKFSILCLFLAVLTAAPLCSCRDTLVDTVIDYVNPHHLSMFEISERDFFAVLEYADTAILGLENKIQNVSCGACHSTFSYLQTFSNDWFIEVVEFFVREACYMSGIEAMAVCTGAVNEMTPIITHSLVKHYLHPNHICPNIYACPAYYKNDDLETFINETIKDKPNKTAPVPTKRATYTVVHLSDIHVDFDYAPGSEANCGEPDCCELVYGQARTSASAAGYWGTLGYPCDIPASTVEQAMRFINEELKPDILLWTGDTIDHTIWRQSPEININATIWATDLMKRTINTTRTQIFPIDGNHECWPVSVYEFDSERETPLKDTLSELWKDWVGEDVAADIKKQMFYSTYYPKFNIRVIALDTNACAITNWFVITNPTDPGHMLAWLKRQLLDAEEKNQNVYIMSHIPSGDDCVYEWGARYNAIIDRFSYIIRAQFAAHTHYDLYQVFYSHLDKLTPVGAQFIAPSLTTFVDNYPNNTVHPSIRMFEMDVDTGLPINLYQYRLNLTKYNALGSAVDKVQWDLAYDFLSEYDLEDMSPTSMDKLRHSIIHNTTIAEKVMKNYFANDKAYMKNTTDLYCEILPVDLEREACKTGTGIAYQKLSFLEWLSGKWFVPINPID